jgi:hypothetical protein
MPIFLTQNYYIDYIKGVENLFVNGSSHPAKGSFKHTLD